MAIPQLKMSDELVNAEWLSPDERIRALNEDYEQGPYALEDLLEGLKFQEWRLTHNNATGDFTVTPADVGLPVIVLNAPNVTQCSFCFDQNAHVNIVHESNGTFYLYWYDTAFGDWVTDQLSVDIISAMLTLDDKRDTQITFNDILLWFTKEVSPGVYTLFHSMQRERFLTDYEMASPFRPYIHHVGMHKGLRVKSAGSY